MNEYRLLRRVLHAHRPKGVALEFGVATGTSGRIIAEYMPVIGFDSFNGLPEAWKREPTILGTTFPAGMFACKPPMINNAQLITGLFEDTLPRFDVPDDVGLVHLDADLYSSTKTVFDHIGPQLKRGTILVFDEYEGDGFDDEKRAFTEACVLFDWAVETLDAEGEQRAFVLL